MEEAIKANKIKSEKIKQQILVFLEAGGRINIIPTGLSGYAHPDGKKAMQVKSYRRRHGK